MNVVKVFTKITKFTRLVITAITMSIIGLFLVIFGTAKVVYVAIDGETLKGRVYMERPKKYFETQYLFDVNFEARLAY